MARPRKEIDMTQFEKLCALQCTESEICSFFEITNKTLYRLCQDHYGESFSNVYKSKSEMGKISLRRYQFRLAEHNVSMAIFLGKQWLGQTEKVETSIERIEVVSDVKAE